MCSMQCCPLLTGVHHGPTLNHISLSNSLVNREHSKARNDEAVGHCGEEVGQIRVQIPLPLPLQSVPV